MPTPSRYEVEHLHRLMMQASQEAAALDKRVAEAQRKDGLGSLLKQWQEAGAGVHTAFGRAREALKKDGTPAEQLDRVEKRLKDVREKAVHFDLQADLDQCVDHWKALGQEFSQLSGKQRDGLVSLLERFKPQVDKATAGLSAALRSEGMLPEDYRALKALREQRDRAREKYERLRQQYLAAEKDWQAAEQQKAQTQRGAVEHTQPGKLPVHTGAKAPVAVRLPVHAGKPVLPAQQKQDAKLGAKDHLQTPVHHAPPPKLAPKPPLHKPAPQPAKPEKPLKPDQHGKPQHADPRKPQQGKPQQGKPQQADQHKPQPGKPQHPAQHKPELGKPQHPAQQKPPLHGKPQHKPELQGKPDPKHKPDHPAHAAKQFPHKLGLVRPSHAQAPKRPEKPSRAPSITVERVERVAGYPEAVDGIGRGVQSAHIHFRAENIEHALRITGTLSVQLGCGVRLDVAPSVQLFAATPNAPLRGKVSLSLGSSGGRLGTITPKSALDNAGAAAKAAAPQVAAKLGIIGDKVRSAIAEVLEDAAEKIFARAHSPRHAAPAHPKHLPQRHVLEHHVGRFGHSLGQIVHHAHAVKGPHEPPLHKILDRDHHGRGVVASRLEQTLSHLATAAHRTLTDKHAGELRGQLARIDSILARVKGKVGHELAEGANEISQILSHIGSIASMKGGAAHIASFRKLIDERRAQLMKLLGHGPSAAKADKPEHARKHHLPPAQRAGHQVLHDLRKHHPALDKLLKNASTAHLAHELAKIEKGALHALADKSGKQGKHAGKHPADAGGLGKMSLTGLFHSLGGTHLGGFGGGHRHGALSGTTGAGGALSKVLNKQLEHHVKNAKPHEVGKLLADLQKAPKGSPLHEVAQHAEKQKKQRAPRAPRKGPPPADLTAHALHEAFSEHPKGKAFAQHVAKGGALYHLCESAQRGRGLPVGHTASHYLASRGSSPLYNTVQTFHSLTSQGHKPRHWGLGSIFKAVSSHVSSAFHAVTSTVTSATQAATSFVSTAAKTVRSGISSVAHSGFVQRLAAPVRGVVQRAVGAARNLGRKALRVGKSVGTFVKTQAQHGFELAKEIGHEAWDTAKHVGSEAWDVAKKAGKIAIQPYLTMGKLAWNAGKHAFHAISGGVSHAAKGLWGAIKHHGKGLWGHIKHGFKGLSHLAQKGLHAVQSGTSWVQGKVGGALDWAKQKAGGAFDSAKGLAGKGIDFIKKTGVVGAVGGMIKKGLSTAGHLASLAWKYSPLGIAVSKGWGLVKSPLGKIWDKTKTLAGKAWDGIKKGYKATAGFLQSPAGQLLVTGLSLAASFIPGGLVVKAIVGGAIGAIQAISEGKDLKGILLSAGSGALTGALPFLKLGPLAKIGMGALTGGITTLAQGGSLGDALKGAAGGAVDAFDPGAMKALGKLKGVSAAGKLLSGGTLSKAEKAFVGGSKLAGPLRGLEKAMTNPRFRKTVGALERVGGKTIKAGIWVSGKAAKAQTVLDKVVGAGDKVHGALEQIHQYAPDVAGFLGDNAAGHFVSSMGDWSGKADDKLSKALEYGHTASDSLSTYRGYLDKGLGYAGVKDPAKAYEKQMAKKGHAKGKKGSLEDVAHQKVQRHKQKHPELHLAEATGKRTKGHKADRAPHKRAPAHHEAVHKALEAKPSKGHSKKPHTALEKAIAKGKELKKKGLKVTQGVHDKLGKIHDVVGKGLATADKVQHGLEKCSELAKQGAGIFGEDSDVGKFLLHASERADQVHGYLEQGIGLAQNFDDKVGAAHDGLEHIPGVHKHGAPDHQKKKGKTPLEEATHLEGKGKGKKEHEEKAAEKKSPHGPHAKPAPAVPGETPEQTQERHKKAWDKIALVSRLVQKFESDYAKALPKIQRWLAEGQTQPATLEIIALGNESDEVFRAAVEALKLSAGHQSYEKETKFYIGWYKQTKAKLHELIADTKGLGNHAQITGFGLSEATHPDIYQNTREIYAIQAKVMAFGEALHDTDAHEHVKKLLADAKKAKSELQVLKAKYRKDKKATNFLTGGGQQDKLIDDSIKKIEAALKGESHEPGKHAPGKIDPHKKPDPSKKKPGDLVKSVEHGLKAIDKYRKKAVKAGRKIDHSLTQVEHALNKGIRIGKKVDSGLGKIAGLADQVSNAFGGDDTPLGHLAHQVSQTAGSGHDKLHETLNDMAKGKSFLHKGHKLFHEGLQIASGHHQKVVTAIHGRQGSPKLPEHLAHVSPHGARTPRELDQVMRDGKKLVHGSEHLWKDGKHAVHDADTMWKDGKHAFGDAKKMAKDSQHAWGDAKHFGHDASHMWGDVKKLVHGDHKHLVKDLKHLWGEGKGLFGEGKHLFKEGKHLFDEGKHLWGEGQKLWGEGKHLFQEGKNLLGEGKDVLHQGKHVVQDISHLLHKGKDWVHGNLSKLHLGGVVEQAKKAWQTLPEWLKGLFGGGGGGKPSPHDPRHGPRHHRHHHRRRHAHPVAPPAPAPEPEPQSGGFTEADIAAVVHGAQGWVTDFGKVVTQAIKEIEKHMKAGDTKAAGDRVEGVSATSEQARSEVTRAVSVSAKYPALHKAAQQASKHYLEIRGHFFKFVKGLHGLAGQALDLQGVDPDKYPDLAELSTDIGSLQVKVDALGELKHADTPMQEMVDELKKEASGLRHRVHKAKGEHRGDEAAEEIVRGLQDKLGSLEAQLGSHSSKKNVQEGDKDLDVSPQGKKPKRRHHRKRPKDDDDKRIHADRGGARGDMDVEDFQDIDSAAMDTWIGSGEGVKAFSEVFGAFLPAEGALVHHAVGGNGESDDEWHEWHTNGGGGQHPAVVNGHGAGEHPPKGHPDHPAVIHGQGTGEHADPHGRKKRKGKGKGGGGFLRKIGGMLPKKVSGFFEGLFAHLEKFAATIGGWAKKGAGLLGKGMHFAQMGMHGLSAIEKAAEKVQGIAGKAEGFLNKIGLGKAAGFAHKIGGAAGWVDKEAKVAHGGLKTADKWMGKGKKIAGQVEGGAGKAHGIFDKAAHGRFGSLVSLFKSSRAGIEGRSAPEKVRLGSALDEPQRLDISTLSRMEGFLGGSFSGVRLHVGPGAAEITKRFNAEAVTVKDHIFFAPGRFNPQSIEGQRLLAHELTHVMQKGRMNLDVRTAEGEALHSERSYGAPQMESLNLSQPAPGFRLGDGEGMGNPSGVYTAKRNRSKGYESGGIETAPPDGEELLEQISGRVYELLMEELEQSFESR